MKIEFTNEQLQVLNTAIVELPFRVAQPLITHINSEIQKRHNEAVDSREDNIGSNYQLDKSEKQ